MLISNYSLVIEIALKYQTNWQIEKYKRRSTINHTRTYKEFKLFDNLYLLHGRDDYKNLL